MMVSITGQAKWTGSSHRNAWLGESKQSKWEGK